MDPSMVSDSEDDMPVEFDNEVLLHFYKNEEIIWKTYDFLRRQNYENSSNLCFRNLDFSRFGLALASISLGSNLEWKNLEKFSMRKYETKKKMNHHVFISGKSRCLSETRSGKEEATHEKS